MKDVITKGRCGRWDWEWKKRKYHKKGRRGRCDEGKKKWNI